MTPSGIWTWTDWRDVVESPECLESLEVWDPVLLGAFASSGTIGTIAPSLGFCVVVRGSSGEPTATLPEQASKTAKGCKKAKSFAALHVFLLTSSYFLLLLLGNTKDSWTWPLFCPGRPCLCLLHWLHVPKSREWKERVFYVFSQNKKRNWTFSAKQCRNSRKPLHGMQLTKKLCFGAGLPPQKLSGCSPSWPSNRGKSMTKWSIWFLYP